MPSTIVTGRTTTIADPNRAWSVSIGRPGLERLGRAQDDTDQADDGEDGDQRLGDGEEPDGLADARPDEVVEERPDGDAR